MFWRGAAGEAVLRALTAPSRRSNHGSWATVPIRDPRTVPWRWRAVPVSWAPGSTVPARPRGSPRRSGAARQSPLSGLGGGGPHAAACAGGRPRGGCPGGDVGRLRGRRHPEWSPPPVARPQRSPLHGLGRPHVV